MKKLGAVLAAGVVLACNTPSADETEKTIVPDAERGIARNAGAEGPRENRGIGAMKALGSIPLDGEFAGLEGRVLRAREVTIEPGGQVAVHQHQQRPGVAYILEGELVEHRQDSAGRVTRRPGDVSFERTGVTHWWSNESDSQARALIVDIVPAGLD